MSDAVAVAFGFGLWESANWKVSNPQLRRYSGGFPSAGPSLRPSRQFSAPFAVKGFDLDRNYSKS